MKNILKITLLFILINVMGCSEDTIDFSGVGKITGRVVEADNFNPIVNAKIVITPSNSTIFSDDEGYFVFDEVASGDYSVSAIKDGFLTSFKPATVSSSLEVNVVFEMEVETASNRPPSTPELISPEDNSTDVSLEVELTWSSKDIENDTIRYNIKIKNDNNDDVQIVEKLLDTTYVLSNLTNGTKYFWQVSATDNINPEVWSTIYSFRTTESTQNRFLYVKSENDNNVIYSSDDLGNESALTNGTQNSWRPRKNLAANKIAFLRTENFETQIYLMNSDGSNVFKVTSSVPVDGFRQSELDFSWSSNGDKLMYPHFDKLYEINKDGSGLRLIYQTSDGSFISECDWSSDGSIIALKTNDSNGYNVSVYTIDMNGNLLTTILSGVNGAAGGLNLSVDNKMLLYTYDISEFESSDYRQLDTRMFIYSFDLGTSNDISSSKIDGTIDVDARFSPSEAEIIFVNTSNDGISQRNIFKQKVTNNTSNNYDRVEMFSNALMPDWE